MRLSQWTELVAVGSFDLKQPRGPAVKVRPGDVFIITSPEHNNGAGAIIDRRKRAKLNLGYYLTRADLATVFGVQAD